MTKGCAPFSRSEVVRFDGWQLHREDRCLTSPAGLVVALSNAEFRLLSLFLQMPRRLFSRDQLMEQARESLYIEMAYIGDPDISAAIAAAAARGVEVVMLFSREANIGNDINYRSMHELCRRAPVRSRSRSSLPATIPPR